MVFVMQMNQIDKVIGKSDEYYVGGEVVVRWKANPRYINRAKFVYGVIQMLMSNKPKFPQVNRNTNFVVVWIVIPFVLGSLALYYAAKYFLKSIRYRPTELIDDDEFASESDGFGHKIANSSEPQDKKK